VIASRTPAQLYALVIGLALLAAGLVGFLSSSAFGSPGKTGTVLGILEVNGWHNLVHLASGLLGLAVASRPRAARTYAGAFGTTYLVVAIWGLTLGPSGAILSFLPVNLADDVLHLLIALWGVFAYMASKDRGVVRDRLGGSGKHPVGYEISR
jgi:Domain of unknown function (DUF4383)